MLCLRQLKSALRRLPGAQSANTNLRDHAVRNAGHQDIYDEVHSTSRNSAPSANAIARTVVDNYAPEHCADRYVSLLTTYVRTIVFTAAPPGQGGTDHVNEQPPEYWIRKFDRHGFRLAASDTDRCHTQWKEAGAQPWYYENVLVFSDEDH